jgi:hypothetical protein
LPCLQSHIPWLWCKKATAGNNFISLHTSAFWFFERTLLFRENIPWLYTSNRGCVWESLALGAFYFALPFLSCFFRACFFIWGWDSGIEWIGLWETALQGSGPGECVSLLLWLSEGETQTEEEVKNIDVRAATNDHHFFTLPLSQSQSANNSSYHSIDCLYFCLTSSLNTILQPSKNNIETNTTRAPATLYIAPHGEEGVHPSSSPICMCLRLLAQAKPTPLIKLRCGS